MTTTLDSLTTAVTDLTRQVDTLRAAADTQLDTAARLDAIETELAASLVKVETLATLLGTPSVADERTGNYQFPTVSDWVDDVFTRIAARHRATWCTRWEHHLEARWRIELLWHTWEAAHAHPVNHAARDEWARAIFDHHTGWLLDPQTGPFAGCRADLCTVPPALRQRLLPSQPALPGVADLAARRRSAAARIEGSA